MSNKENLKDKSQVPEDLKTLITQWEISPTDPKVQLIIWFWNHTTEFKANMESARASMAAVLDTRIDQMNGLATVVVSVDRRLVQVLDELGTKPLGIKEQVEKELAIPLKNMVESYRKLDQHVKSLLQRIEHKTALTRQALYWALFVSGFMGGGLTALCLGHFFG